MPLSFQSIAWPTLQNRSRETGLPLNSGDFFQPLSTLLLIGTLGTLASGWQQPKHYKLWLWIPLGSLLVIWVATPTLFWPMIRDLYGAGTGLRPLAEPVARSLVQRWLVYDGVRTVLIAVGFVSSIQALHASPRSPGA